MAYNLNFNEQTAKHSFFSVKEKAWHGLGQIVHGYPNSAEAIKFAGLDYHVEKRKLFTYVNENNYGNSDNNIITPEIEVPNFYATTRTDTQQVLGVVGKDYEVVQNADAFRFFDGIVGGDGILYETAGHWVKENSHVYNAHVEKYTSISNQDGTHSKVTNAVLSSFHPAKPVPCVISAAMFSAPSSTFVPASTPATSSAKDPSHQPVIDLDSYDASGNVVQDQKDNDVKHSYIWDYHISMPVAELINAQITDVVYTCFEADGTGNWTLNNGNVNTLAGITGINSFTLGGLQFG